MQSVYFNNVFLSGVCNVCSTSLSPPPCIEVPNDTPGITPHIIWPRSRESSDGYSNCPALEEGLSTFMNCASFTQSAYLLSLSGNMLCLENSDMLLRNETLKIYTVYTNMCPGLTCTIMSISSSSWITQQCEDHVQ